MIRVFGLVFGIGFILATHPNLWAAEKDSIGEIIAGFKEEKFANTDASLDDIIKGFDDNEQTADSTPIKAPSPISLNGHLKIGAAYNTSHKATETGETDWRGWSRLKTEAGLELQIKCHDHWRLLINGKYFYDWSYSLKGRDEFRDEVLDQYEKKAELGEAYLQGRLNHHLDLKAGRQIVVWGRSDNIRVTDVLNPLDFREPGLIDIEELRLPVTMTRMDGYWGSWNLTAIAGHEIRFNKNPVFGHDFFPGTSPLPPEEKFSNGGSHTEWALALNGIFIGKDLSFYWADLYEEDTHVEWTPVATLVREHARVTMWGVAGSLAVGNWLLIGEGTYWHKLKFFNVTGQTFDRLDALIGIEYNGWIDTTVSLDWAVRHIFDFDGRTEAAPDYAQKDAIETALRISKNFLNDTLEVTVLAMLYGTLGQDGALERLSLKYEWSDTVSTTVGVALYQSGDTYRLSNIEENDRIYWEIKYSF